MDELLAQFYVYIKGIWKYRWVSMALAWVIALAGWFAVCKLPDNYEASARIYVDTQNILRPLMAGITVAPNLQQQVSILSRTLISRPNVDRIVRMVDLDVTLTSENDRERLISELMKEIKLGAAKGTNIFTISYENKDPLLAKDIVQSLLTIFVEEGLDGKRQDSATALRFVDDQIKAYEEKLVIAENALAAFKQKNLGLLAGQRGDYYSQLQEADAARRGAELSLKEAQQARNAIKKQISGDEPVVVLEGGTPDAKSIVNPELDARIKIQQEKLDELSLNFTDLHPDIIAAKRLISMLEEQKIEESKKSYSPSQDPGMNYSPMLQQLNVALTDAEAVVASMQARLNEYTSRFNRLRSLSNAIPQVEAEFTQLNRDYNVNKANYEQLLERRASAKMSGELTSASGLLSFRIIDPPTVPDLPNGPDRQTLFSLVLLGSLVFGVGVAFIISQIRPAFHSQTSLREITGLTVLGTVPMIWTDQQKMQRKRRLFAFSLSVLLLMLLYALLMLYMKQPAEIVGILPF